MLRAADHRHRLFVVTAGLDLAIRISGREIAQRRGCPVQSRA